MPSVMIESDEVSCGHPPGAAKTQGSPKLLVDGSGVLLVAGVLHATIEGPCSTPASGNSQPCTLVTVVTPPSPPPKLLVDGQPVLLSPVTGATDGKVGGIVQAFLSGNSAQTKLVVT